MSTRMRGDTRFFLHYGDVTDATNLIRIIQETQPDEIYNLAAQSHVHVSFETPEYTANADAIGTLRLLEAMHILKMQERVRFYQASTSELFGDATAAARRVDPLPPAQSVRSREGVRVLDHRQLSRGVWHSRLQRDSLQPRRSPRGARLLSLAKSPVPSPRLKRESRRCCTWATSTFAAIGATPATMSRACGESCSKTGRTITSWQPGNRTRCASCGTPPSTRSASRFPGRGRQSTKQGIDAKTGIVRVAIDSRYFRPTEVVALLRQSSQGLRKAGWRHTFRFEELVKSMVAADRELLAQQGPGTGGKSP